MPRILRYESGVTIGHEKRAPYKGPRASGVLPIYDLPRNTVKSALGPRKGLNLACRSPEPRARVMPDITPLRLDKQLCSSSPQILLLQPAKSAAKGSLLRSGPLVLYRTGALTRGSPLAAAQATSNSQLNNVCRLSVSWLHLLIEQLN